MNPVVVAARGKGAVNMLKRTGVIGRRYGLTAGKMDRILAHFVGILRRFDCGATFPVTSAALARSRGVIEKYQAQNVEFAVHGYYHVDHAHLTLAQQIEYFTKARRLFAERGVTCSGFRCPYLRWSEDTVTAVKQTGFLYDSSPSLAWGVPNGLETEAYHRVLNFYGAMPAASYPSLPRWDNGLVRIPYSVPDDEALIDRLLLTTPGPMIQLWLALLAETYRLGELFTLGLHPERVYLCEAPLVETLRAARALSPGVWIARLDEITRWWQARTEATVTIRQSADDVIHLSVGGPDGVTILARGVEALVPVAAWDDGYVRAKGREFRFHGGQRPFIGISHTSSPYLASFLRQQGYIVETADGRSQNGRPAHVLYLDRPAFTYEDERPLLAFIEESNFPLVRLGRWPHGMRSALAITGDIDALTIWDYGLRFLGR